MVDQVLSESRIRLSNLMGRSGSLAEGIITSRAAYLDLTLALRNSQDLGAAFAFIVLVGLSVAETHLNQIDLAKESLILLLSGVMIGRQASHEEAEQEEVDEDTEKLLLGDDDQQVEDQHGADGELTQSIDAVSAGGIRFDFFYHDLSSFLF